MWGYEDLFENAIIDINIHSKKRKEISFSDLYFYEDFANYSPGPEVFHNIFKENFEINQVPREISCNIEELNDLQEELKNNHRHRSKLCQEPNCKKIASFNFAYDRKRIYCATHRKVGMINVAHRKCASFGCNTIPNFNYPNHKSKIFCKAHKKPGMINIARVEKCRFPTCTKPPSFNYPGEKKAVYCESHQKPGMIDIKSKLRKTK